MAEILRFKQTMPNNGVPMYASDWPLLQAQMLQASLTLYNSLSQDMILSGVVPTLSFSNPLEITGISAGYVILGGEIYEFIPPSSIAPSTTVLYIVIDETAGVGTKTSEYRNRTVKIGAAESPVLEVKKAKVATAQPASPNPYIKFNPYPSSTYYSSSITPASSPFVPVYLNDLIAFHSRKKGEIISYGGSLKSIENIDLFSPTGLGLYSYRGFALCNGNNGTVNLQGRFIVGTGSYSDSSGAYNYSLGNFGGEAKHKLITSEIPSHSHAGFQGKNFLMGSSSLTGLNTKFGDGEGITNGIAVSTTTTSGGDQFHENRPPYYALAFIQKIS